MGPAEKEILDGLIGLEKCLPKNIRDKILLTGGAAAFLYGSDRAFSHDMDFMIPREHISDIEKALGISFEYHTQKPVFQSLKVVFKEGVESFDIIAESVVSPADHGLTYTFFLTDQIRARQGVVKIKDRPIHLIPKELLVLIKLLAGRGNELGKYDLYDSQKILAAHPDFDMVFFADLIKEFCNPLEKSLPILKSRLSAIMSGHQEEGVVLRLSEVLSSLQQSG